MQPTKYPCPDCGEMFLANPDEPSHECVKPSVRSIDDDLVRRAFLLAYRAHGTQKYGEAPYLVHLFDTYNVLLRYGHDRSELLAAALLHDVIEDTPTNYNQVLQATNKEVAEIVYACTDELGRSRKERKVRTFKHLHAWTTHSGEAALTVKLADWIANVQAALRDEESKLQMYAKDWPDFSDFRERFPCEKLEPMWKWLDDLFFK